MALSILGVADGVALAAVTNNRKVLCVGPVKCSVLGCSVHLIPLSRIELLFLYLLIITFYSAPKVKGEWGEFLE